MQVRLNAFAAILSFGFVIAVVLGMLWERPSGRNAWNSNPARDAPRSQRDGGLF